MLAAKGDRLLGNVVAHIVVDDDTCSLGGGAGRSKNRRSNDVS
jgi:hypothetical protein